MGKKKGGCGGGEKYAAAEEAVAAVPAAREFVLKVAMHCRCHGCTDKVRAAVRDLTQAAGVEAADCSAAESSGELRLLATADPEKLRRRLRRATGKRVDLLLPKERAAAAKKQEDGGVADAAALQALLAELQLQAPAPAAGEPAAADADARRRLLRHQQRRGLRRGLPVAVLLLVLLPGRAGLCLGRSVRVRSSGSGTRSRRQRGLLRRTSVARPRLLTDLLVGRRIELN